MFRRIFAVLLVSAGIVAVLVSGRGIAASAGKSSPIKHTHNGPMTRSGNQTWQMVSLPLRLVTGATGLALGAIQGGLQGVVTTEEQFAQNIFGEADESPWLVPVGLIGTIAAVPVGLATGTPQGAAQGGSAGYHLWDQF